VIEFVTLFCDNPCMYSFFIELRKKTYLS